MIEIAGLKPHEVADMFPAKTVMVALRGSHSHGTYIPPVAPTGTDDVDYMGVYIPTGLSDYFGLKKSPDVVERKIGVVDTVTYEFRKFVSLLLKCNPNVLGMLWLDRKHYVELLPEMEELIKHRELFSSKMAYHSFAGYAHSQLKRMTAFGTSRPACGCKGTFHEKECPIAEEKGRGSSKLYATGFMGEKRKALVQKYGYDVKNAAHCIRLLKMGNEFLTTGAINVDRTNIDADSLIQIKQGKWTLAEVVKWAEDLFAEMKELVKKSPLPENPATEKVEQLVTDILVATKAAEVVLRKHHWSASAKFPSVYDGGDRSGYKPEEEEEK